MLDKLRANLKLFSILVFVGCVVLLATNALMAPRFPMPTVEYHVTTPAQSSPTNELIHNVQPDFTFPVNINEASAAAFEEIKGIGPVMAQRIVDYRNEKGGFSSVDELLNVKGIGEKTLEKMLPFICLE